MPADIVFAGDARNPFVVVDKPAGLPSAPLSEADAAPNALRLIAGEFPGVMRVRGRKAAEHGLVHRIDTEASGLLLFALTQEAYDFFADEQRHGRFRKSYTAFCHRLPDTASRLGGFPPAPADVVRGGFVCRSRFCPWGRGRREVRPVTADSAPAVRKKAGAAVYETAVSALSIAENAPPQQAQPDSAADGGAVYRLAAETARGFRHQVRCHLAWRGFPVIGDTLYHPAYRGGGEGETARRQRTLFFASGLSFRHPLTGEEQAFALPVHGGD
jgi:23S rRNA pseudouridine1911/1915/1917 synthase